MASPKAVIHLLIAWMDQASGTSPLRAGWLGWRMSSNVGGCRSAGGVSGQRECGGAGCMSSLCFFARSKGEGV